MTCNYDAIRKRFFHHTCGLTFNILINLLLGLGLIKFLLGCAKDCQFLCAIKFFYGPKSKLEQEL